MAFCRVCGQGFDPAAPVARWGKDHRIDRRIRRIAGGRICPRCLYRADDWAWVETGKVRDDGRPVEKRVLFTETHLNQQVLYLFERMAKRKARGQSILWCEADEGRCLNFSSMVTDGHHVCKQHGKQNSSKRQFGSFEAIRRRPIILWATSHEELMDEARRSSGLFGKDT